ncbi:MAG: hypothetical protein IJ675_05290 [Pseudobutyrivibrio sp.]|nr:hypothetical protein [Pseudobutyrivibrio sp.]
MRGTGFKPGDTIKCHSCQEMHEKVEYFKKLGIRTDYLYEKNGVEGMWVIIEPVHP